MPGKPIVRGYDSSPLFREDCLLRIQHLQMEVDADMKRIVEFACHLLFGGGYEFVALLNRLSHLSGRNWPTYGFERYPSL